MRRDRLLVLLVAGLLTGPAPARPEVQLLELEDGTTGSAAGLLEGDVLIGWRRAETLLGPAADGVFDDPFDLVLVGLEQPPLGPVVLSGRRGQEPLTLEVPYGPWDAIRAAPVLEGKAATAYTAALDLWRRGEQQEAIDRWLDLAGRLDESATPRERSWWSFHLAERLLEVGDVDQARARYEEAIAALGEEQPAVEGLLRRRLGELLLFDLGLADDAAQQLETSLDLRRKVAPRSFAVADSLDFLSEVPRLAERYDDALALVGEWLDLVSSLGPGSYPHAAALAGAGYLSWRLGDLAAADAYYSAALPLAERAPPRHQNPGLVVIALIARQRGEEERYRQLMQRDIDWRLAGDSPRSHALAYSYAATLAADQNDYEQAELETRRALEIRRQLYPEASHPVAASISALGLVRKKRGDLAEARVLLEQALALFEELAPAGASSAELLRELGDLAADTGDLDLAEQRYRAATRIGDGVVPFTAETARAHTQLGRLLRRRGSAAAAAAELEAALLAIEAQAERLGGSDERRVAYRARHGELYRELIALELELGRKAPAFAVLERSRARQLLELLRQRTLDWARELPSPLAEELAALTRRQTELLADLADRSADDPAIGDLHHQLDQLGAERRLLRDRVASVAPRVAAARFPQPLDLAGARAALRPGTLLLSYSVDRDATTLFALGPDGDDLEVIRLDIGEERLGESVARWRGDLERAAPLRRSERRELAAKLSETLLGRVSSRLERSERLLVIGDGPLHQLPFAALPDPAAGDRLLLHRLPITHAPSVSVLVELSSTAPSESPTAVAFGDPLYPTGASPGSLPPALRGGGLELLPLPETRREVAALANRFPGRTTVWTGRDATEDRAKAVGRSAQLLHFACHASLDERFPMESALVLSLPPAADPRGEDGLLQAWEIFDQLRLDADLVTLSACDTALGTSVDGEGMLGLTRAFHYAGARAVLATLWRISDESTAELMDRFYAAIARGDEPSIALRHAQLALATAPVVVERGGERHERDLSDPYHWAAFRLSGP